MHILLHIIIFLQNGPRQQDNKCFNVPSSDNNVVLKMLMQFPFCDVTSSRDCKWPQIAGRPETMGCNHAPLLNSPAPHPLPSL